MGKMRLKDYTILLVPDHTSEVRRFRLSRIKIILSGSALLLFFLSSIYFGVGYFTNLKVKKTLEQLTLEHQNLKAQFLTVSHQLTSFQNRLNRINELDHKIRLATGLEGNSNIIMGMGGPENQESALELLLPPEEASRVREVVQKLNQLDLSLDSQEQSLEELDAFISDNQSIIRSTPSIWPVRGWVTSEFGTRVSPFHAGMKFHQGIDIAAPVGTLIRTTADGIVSYAGWERGYGNLVIINHGYGISTRYAHCAEILVKKGDRVKRGQVIATVGATGRATGPHLHYEVRLKGVPVNPRKYLFE